jgi:hypothetical protein
MLLNTLAAAYAEAGRYRGAVATAEEAMTEAQRRNLPELSRQVMQRRALYAAGKPFHEGP